MIILSSQPSKKKAKKIHDDSIVYIESADDSQNYRILTRPRSRT